MRFTLIDSVLELTRDDQGHPVRAVALKHVTAAEEYLADHFPGFPILPGVFMLEAMVHTARHVAHARDSATPASATSPADTAPLPWVLGSARAVKYGRMVPPGSTLRLDVELLSDSNGVLEFKGVGTLIDRSATTADTDAGTAVSGRFTLRRPNLE